MFVNVQPKMISVGKRPLLPLSRANDEPNANSLKNGGNLAYWANEPFGCSVMNDETEYDVAISFLASNEETARALYDRLEGSGLRVFFFPGVRKSRLTNGMEPCAKEHDSCSDAKAKPGLDARKPQYMPR